MTPLNLSPDDLKTLQERALTPLDLERQVDHFIHPPPPLRLARPAIPGDGIHILSTTEADDLSRSHQAPCEAGRFLKFVPASGAATRMFDSLLQGDAGSLERFKRDLERFAFAGEIKDHLRARGIDPSSMEIEVLMEAVAGPKGPNLAHRPKGLLPFHRTSEGVRTPVEEHLVEAHHGVRDARGDCRIHFTVSPEHRDEFERVLPAMAQRMGGLTGSRFDVGFSAQEKASETLAVDPGNRPFRDGAGRLVFRPGGHGALLRNLQAVGGDLVFIKNIDNVVPDRLKGPSIRWKKVLAGLLVRIQEQVHATLKSVRAGGAAPTGTREFFQRWFFADPWAKSPDPKRIIAWLDRPIRVCGVVRNTGEPGGGPYWVQDPDGSVTLQIVEKAQADLADPGQKALFEGATHFNPVDLVCAMRDPDGRPYELSRFVDPTTVLVSRKTLDGQALKAFEWPGLWNGAMKGWRTVLVEVPLETFDPVKTVFDLLRPRHQGEED